MSMEKEKRQVSTVLEPQIEKRTRKKFEPRWYVILHDDQDHTYPYVIDMLTKLFKMSMQDALIKTIEVDTRGVSILARLSKEKALQKRNEIMQYGGDPLMETTVSMKASIEPCDD